MRGLKFALALLCLGYATTFFAQTPDQSSTVVVKPKAFDGALVNPDIGFTTFQRFNGDSLNAGTDWTEGFPIDYQPFHGSLKNKDYPETSIAYFRIYWKFVEPEKGVYNWDIIDKALRTAHERHQTLMLRIAPYGSGIKTGVPDWYRQETGEVLRQVPSHSTHHSSWERPPNSGPSWQPYNGQWMVDPMNPAYAHFFGDAIRALGARYDGDPDLNLVDISIVGPWGEGAGTQMLSTKAMHSLMDSYLDSFHKTPLVIQPFYSESVAYALSKANVGWRADCLGDMGGFSKTSNHMEDRYPEAVVENGIADAWKKAPVTMESCWVMQTWENNGWDIPYIMDQAIKWHVSSFNNKSSAVPKDLWPKVNEWLKHMGYRFALRRFTYPSTVGPSRKIAFTTWWENKGDAPAYRQFPFAIRLSNGKETAIMLTNSDIRTWMPGDNLYNDSVFIPANLPDGDYSVGVAIVDPATREPNVKLAIDGIGPDGWYPMGRIGVHQTLHVKQ
ncbi:MAG: DUF4832 domain-containing protein [Acidobacteriaceae bacterium]